MFHWKATTIFRYFEQFLPWYYKLNVWGSNRYAFKISNNVKVKTGRLSIKYEKDLPKVIAISGKAKQGSREVGVGWSVKCSLPTTWTNFSLFPEREAFCGVSIFLSMSHLGPRSSPPFCPNIMTSQTCKHKHSLSTTAITHYLQTDNPVPAVVSAYNGRRCSTSANRELTARSSVYSLLIANLCPSISL